jgi:carboxy-terminal domain RNA polymerase II polypeptide A small phosphatase
MALLESLLLNILLQSVPHADFIVPVQIEHHWHNFYVLKRPGVDNFLKKMGEIYEVVVFTASLSTVRGVPTLEVYLPNFLN